ncbi:12791_t:CDS:10 [Entrophospora sp. SA101]|nr:12791_t:CDS:10 [Entrophospora sp. SA101]CAJ0875597.1 15132_t:CDS:10 [Entrophospora sp. SA101]
MIDNSDEEDSRPGLGSSMFSKPKAVDKDFASFEKHTKGTASYIMSKMGYVPGQGLGSDGRGIVNPIEVKLRPSKMGLAYQISSKVEKRANEWKKSSQKKKRKDNYKTAEEIIRDVGLAPSLQPQKIIDMTQPQIRELSTSQITSMPIPERSKYLIELRHNLRLIVDMSKLDLEQTSEKQKLAMTGKSTAIISKEQLEKNSSFDDKISVNNAMISAEIPSLNEIFSEHFQKLLEEFLQWKRLLRTSLPTVTQSSHLNLTRTDRQEKMSPYESMLWSIWLPKVQSSITNKWDVQDYDPVVTLLSNWQPILPKFIYDNITTQLIVPKLLRKLDEQISLENIHLWIFPWFPLLEEQLINQLIDQVKVRLGSYLKNRWNPIDEIGLKILNPWNKVFRQEVMHKLLAGSVRPKLANILRNRFEVNSINQDMKLFDCVMIWKDMFTSDSFSQLFAEEFFPKWLDALQLWITSDPELFELKQWYEDWKSVFPEELLNNTIIISQFNKGMEQLEEYVARLNY